MHLSNKPERKIIIIFFLLMFSAVSCKKEKTLIQGYFESLHMVREGGGEIDFTVYPTNSPDMVKVKLSKYNFRDTSVEFILGNTIDCASALNAYQQAMNNKMQINGSFKQPALETGTWAYLYFVYDNIETEVTNTSLRDSLLKFEQIVRHKIEK